MTIDKLKNLIMKRDDSSDTFAFNLDDSDSDDEYSLASDQLPVGYELPVQVGYGDDNYRPYYDDDRPYYDDNRPYDDDRPYNDDDRPSIVSATMDYLTSVLDLI